MTQHGAGIVEGLARLRGEIAAFDAAAPLEAAIFPPSSWHTWPEIAELERVAVFGRHWLAAVPAEKVAEPGSYAAASIADEPIVIVRGEDQVLRAFFNVCRHRAAEIATGEGRCERLVCPYHGWTYSLDGQLLRAPELGAVANFDRQRHSLAPRAVEIWGPFAFVSLAEAPRNLSVDLSRLTAMLDSTGWTGLRHVASRRYVMECNWKVFVENYLDGGYHVSHLHGGLAGQLDLEQYRTEVFYRFSVQSCGAAVNEAPSPTGGDFAERIGAGALYAWIYPNFMINRYGPIMDTNLVRPLSPNRCEVLFDYFFEPPALADQSFVERSLAASHAVQLEDNAICESVQRGLRSKGFFRGPYSVLRERAQLHFHKLLAADLMRGLEEWGRH